VAEIGQLGWLARPFAVQPGVGSRWSKRAHDVRMNEFAGAALPSQKFGANAAWLRLNVILYNLLSAYSASGYQRISHRQTQAAAFLASQHRW
jgi:hypothetical protein